MKYRKLKQQEADGWRFMAIRLLAELARLRDKRRISEDEFDRITIASLPEAFSDERKERLGNDE